MNPIRHDVFVGNVFHTTTDEQLREAFSQVGKVIAVRQMTEKETGKAKGYGECLDMIPLYIRLITICLLISLY